MAKFKLSVNRNVVEEAIFEANSIEEAYEMHNSGELWQGGQLKFTEVCGEILEQEIEEVKEDE